MEIVYADQIRDLLKNIIPGMADELHSSADTDQVISPKPQETNQNKGPDKLEQYLKAIAESTAQNALSIKSLAEAASRKRRKTRRKSHVSESADSSDSVDSPLAPKPKRKRSTVKSSARSFAHHQSPRSYHNPARTLKKACSSLQRLQKEDKRVPNSPSGSNGGSSLPILTNDNDNLIDNLLVDGRGNVSESVTGEMPAPQLTFNRPSDHNPLIKGLSSKNTSKGKSLAQLAGSVEEDEESYSHEEEFSALGELEMAMSNRSPSSGVPPEPLPVIGNAPSPTWSPSSHVFDWFLTVADINLKKENLDEISEQYKPSDQVADHFHPPKLPEPVWQNVKSSSQYFGQKVVYQAQEYLLTALKPMLSVLEDPSIPTNSKAKISAAIQLVCSSNLQLNRYRRAMSSPHLNKDVRKSILSIPVKHNSLFGDDFHKSVDEAIKLQASTSKALAPARPPFSTSRGKGSYPYNYLQRNQTVPNSRSSYGPSHRGQHAKGPSGPGHQSRGQPFRGRGRGRGRFRSRSFN